MKLNEIRLHNFGSYEGTNTIKLNSDDTSKRVTVIGGKNGAGKTTLFTAIQVCLYGHYSFGFKTISKRYLTEVFTLINNRARINENGEAYIQVSFQQVDDTDLFDYEIKRFWTWNDTEITEKLTVWQDGNVLDEDEVLNFQNYLLHLIPPDMLKLYFFDGERIADYFLDKKEINIRDALMILSGNDTFDILYENVKRVLRLSEAGSNDAADKYLVAKKNVESLSSSLSLSKREMTSIELQLDETIAELHRVESEYAAHGGITISEWKALNDKLKEEEEKRERLNWQRKAVATDTLPFLMLPEMMAKLPKQLMDEKAYHAYEVLKMSIDSKDFSDLISSALSSIGKTEQTESAFLLSKIRNFLLDSKWDTFIPLFGVSDDEETQIQSVLARVKGADQTVFRKYQKRINSSIRQSKEIRDKLQNSNIEHFEEYVKTTASLNEEIHSYQVKLNALSEKIEGMVESLTAAESKLRSEKKLFEDQLKRNSISALSGRVLIMLEELQGILYSALIEHVEHDLNEKFRQLIRKRDFFTKIQIDPDFSVHILRAQPVSVIDLLSLLKGNTFSAAKSVLGENAVTQLCNQVKARTPAELHAKLEKATVEEITLPLEIDKDHLSSGEKQIFVMSLYWALMNQSKNDLPFIIDTPFARIDTEHRANITEHFFKKLSGELIILSTNEELSNSHLKSMSDQIAQVYMLDYGEDKRTYIHSGKYFEV